jgi:hypothetical protein
VVIRKAWLLLLPAALGLLIAAQWPDIRRYLTDFPKLLIVYRRVHWLI